MLQNNPLLAQLKQQIQSSKPKVEGIVRATDKSFGFLDCDKDSYFISPVAMKKLMHGDEISAIIEIENDKSQAVPQQLIKPSIQRFVARIKFNSEKRLQIVVDHPQIRQILNARKAQNIANDLQDGDWVIANLITHPLRDDKFWLAEITEFICTNNDNYAPWWVTLAKHQQSRYPVAGLEEYTAISEEPRKDLTNLPFITIDSASTKDMDDALYIETNSNGWDLWIAVADPTAYFSADSILDQEASLRCFTNYLPSFNVPMLPRELADEICSLTPNQEKLALVCKISLNSEGNILSDAEFHLGKIKSQAKLDYDEVSDYLEHQGNWQPNNSIIAEQINQLHQFAKARITWRSQNVLTFSDHPDFKFKVNNEGEVIAIESQHRRIANKIVEEAMILANNCAGIFLTKNSLNGIFNCHSGFDKKFLNLAKDFLCTQLKDKFSPEELEKRYSLNSLTSLAGYCAMRRDLTQQSNGDYLEMRLRRLLSFAEFKEQCEPHFGLGLSAYATWTSPIRKYNDIINHRIIKSYLRGDISYPQINEQLLQRLQDQRRLNRLVERDIADWLYAEFLISKIGEHFTAQIMDINRAGLRVQLLENGAMAFIPASTIVEKREDYELNSDNLTLDVQGKQRYKIGDQLIIEIMEVNIENRSVVAKIHK